MKVNENIINNIIALTNQSDYKKGLQYDPNKIKLIIKRSTRNGTEYVLRVQSSRNQKFYFINLTITKNKKIEVDCDCPQYDLTGSCKHIAACLYFYNSTFFEEKKNKDKIALTKEILTSYLPISEKKQIKEEVFITFEFDLYENYFGQALFLNMKIGNQKMYSLNNKFRQFMESYQYKYSLKFGKDFTYDPEIHFFNKETQNILTFIKNNFLNFNYGNFRMEDEDVKELLSLMKNQEIFVNGEKVKEIIEKNPYHISLEKQNDHYLFKIKTKSNKITELTSDQEYLYSDGIIYHTNKNVRDLLKKMEESDLEELEFVESDINTFASSILPFVKNELQIDKSIDNLVIGTTPNVKIYFDFKEIITAKITFEYNKEKIDYFTPQTNHLLRDIEYENSVLERLTSLNFKVSKNTIYLDDMDEIGEFLEFGLESLSEYYEIFTSEKLKETTIHKNNKVTSTFSIGKDNIMHLSFKLDNIEDQELEKILASLKKKKKYFKLSSGDILSLENQELNELEELMDELDMTYEEVLDNGGKIPKYYALYLDSLRKKKYKIIKTDNSFDNFIENFHKYQNLNLSFNKEEEKILRDYQKDGIKWLYTVYKCGFGGILADEMGLGKSLQTIIFFQKILKEKKNSKFLIVAPTSLLYNWKNEFQKFAKEIEVCILNENKKHREKLLNQFTHTVYITSYGLVREDEELYKDKYFEVCVIDEAQNIKNPKAGISKSVKKISSNHKLALTGTPIENNITELWSIFDFIMPGFLSSLTNFQGKYHITDFNEKTTELLNNLKKQIEPFILRRKKESVAKDLPPKIENTIFIDLSEKEQKLYTAEVKKTDKKMQELIENVGFSKARIEILKLLMKLRQLCISPSILYDNFEETSSKIENLMKVVNETVLNGHKILLFTSFRTALDLVKKELDKNNLTSYVINGSTPSKTRMELVNKFNKDNTNVFLIMLKSGGTGLNLTSADVVIHLDLWWNPQSENQATDRTHRIGQKKTVEVIKLVMKGTIEEKILELQKKKKILSDQLIETNNVDPEILKKLTEEDIKNLLSFENKMES